jgi:hypothetical protein
MHGADRIEALSKPQIATEGKARADEKAQHTGEYVSILAKPPDCQWRDGLKYKAKRVLKGTIRCLGLSFAKQNNRPATQPSGVRWGFEMASKHTPAPPMRLAGRPLHNPFSLGSVSFLTHLRLCSLNRANSALRPQTVHDLPTVEGRSPQPNGYPKKLTMNVRKSYAKVSQPVCKWVATVQKIVPLRSLSANIQ